ncbi:MAG: hypothetical protein IPH35_10535 [Rhodoferax sp.]|nr:hypothetical protein [Rhodoferax sp.]
MRSAEIKAWLQAHPEVQHFVILDDQYASEFRAQFSGKFVLTSGYLQNDSLAAGGI